MGFDDRLTATEFDRAWRGVQDQLDAVAARLSAAVTPLESVRKQLTSLADRTVDRPLVAKVVGLARDVRQCAEHEIRRVELVAALTALRAELPELIQKSVSATVEKSMDAYSTPQHEGTPR